MRFQFYTLLLVLQLIHLPGWCQNLNTDSLENKLGYSYGQQKLELLHLLSEAYQNSHSKKSIEYAKQAIRLSLDLGDSLLTGESLQILGNSYLLTGNIVMADSSFKRAETHFYHQEAIHHLAGLKIDQAQVLVNQNNMDFAYQTVEEALPTIQKAGLITKELKALNILAGISYYRGNYDKALALTQNISELHLREGQLDRYAAVILNTGSIYQVKGSYVQALKHYQLGLDIADSVDAITYIIHAHELIGGLHAARNRFDQATAFYQTALDLSVENQLISKQIATLHNLGDLYSKSQAYSKADSILKAALYLSDSIGNELFLANGQSLRGANYHRWDQPVQAIAFLHRALAYFDKERISTHAVNTFSALAEAYYQLNDLGKAKEYGEQGLSLAKRIGHRKAEMQLRELLTHVYLGFEDLRLALKHQVLADKIEDSLFQAEQHIVIEEMNARFELDKREEEIGYLQNESELQQALVSRQQNQLIIIALSSTLLFLLLALLYRNYKQKVIANKKLQNALDDKEVLLKEVHHRVKNNLQVVATILRLQQRRSEDPEVLNVVQEMESRVDSIALIHEDLYKKEDVSQVNMQTYLDKLLNNNLHLHQTEHRISHSIDAPIKIPLDLAIPLALITNELTTNALKHAFPDSREGKIHVSLLEKNDSFMELTVEDNGIGMKEDDPKGESFGLEIVYTLTEQLKGHFQFSNNGNTVAKLRFKPFTV